MKYTVSDLRNFSFELPTFYMFRTCFLLKTQVDHLCLLIHCFGGFKFQDDTDEVTWQSYKGQLTEKQEKTREKILKRMEKVSSSG